MSKEIKCTISGCGQDATNFTMFNHPDESLRWEANLCQLCSEEAFEKSKGGDGVLTFLPPKIKSNTTALSSLSRRDWFAGQALKEANLSATASPYSFRMVADNAYNQADAMIERSKR